jgi:hypothetical protein
MEGRPYLDVWKKGARTPTNTKNFLTKNSSCGNAVIERSVEEALEEQDLAVRMQHVRHIRKIAAAYRIAGISMLPCPDDEVLALRFDIQVDGSFVACYHCFFDLVIYEDNHDDREEEVKEDLLHMRLIQHTLPPSVPLASILEKTMGGVACIGPFNNDANWEYVELMDRLRKCANEIYQACYCFNTRKQTLSLLKSFDGRVMQGNAPTGQLSFKVDELTCSDRLDKIAFKLELLSGISSLQVTLGYKDPMCVQPTNVSVKNLAASSVPRGRNRFYAVEVSDDDDDNSNVRDDLIDSATVAFRRLPVRKALVEVAEAMAEW